MRALTAVLVVLLLALQITLWFGKGGVADVAKLEQTLAEQQQELEALRARNSGLAAEVMDLKEGLDAVEELARSEMGMIKQDEVFFQLIEPNPKLANSEKDPATHAH